MLNDYERKARQVIFWSGFVSAILLVSLLLFILRIVM
jgi:hypothetical protein